MFMSCLVSSKICDEHVTYPSDKGEVDTKDNEVGRNQLLKWSPS